MFTRNYLKIIQAQISSCLSYGTVTINNDIFPSLVNTGGFTASNTTYGSQHLLLVNPLFDPNVSFFGPDIMNNTSTSLIHHPDFYTVNGIKFLTWNRNTFNNNKVVGTLVLGNGTVEPTIDDYTIAGDSFDLTGITTSSQRYISYDFEKNDYINTLKMILNNTSTRTIKATELAIIFNNYNGSNPVISNNYRETYMIFRDVFPEVTLNPGEVKTLEIITRTPQYNPIVETPIE